MTYQTEATEGQLTSTPGAAPTDAQAPNLAPGRHVSDEGALAMTHHVYGDGPEDPDDQSGPHENDAWDTEADVICPCCGEAVTIGLDPGGGPSQSYVEDCQVCCQPWRVEVSYDDNGVAQVWVEAG